MLVSIIVCNYNYGRFLRHAIDSALAQTHAPVELIVVDDGSTDDSLEILRSYGDGLITIAQPNAGQIAAYNRGFERARGEVVIFLDADDTLDRDACRELLPLFADPRVVKVHYRMRLIADDGAALGAVLPRTLDRGDLGELLLRHGRFYASSPGSGNAYRRVALERLMPLPSAREDRHGADFFCVYGVSLLGQVASAGERPLASYRVHTAHATEKVGFGNAGVREPEKTLGRFQRLRGWLIERLGANYELPGRFVDFSTEKQIFASRIFNQERYHHGLREGANSLRSALLESIWSRPTGRVEKLGLTAWAVAVCVLPRALGRPLARYVCNPASRSVMVRELLAIVPVARFIRA